MSTKYLGALAVLLVIIGGLAFVLQFNPNRSSSGGVLDPGKTAGGPAKIVCRFLMGKAMWDPENPRYHKEIEKGEPGHYDFPFDNPTDAQGAMGLINANCACSSVLVAFPDEASWQKLVEARKQNKTDDIDAKGLSWVRVVRDETAARTAESAEPAKVSVPVPPHAKGVLRLGWDGRGSPGEKRLEIDIWHKMTGDDKGYGSRLELGIAIRTPIMVFPQTLDVGAIGPKGSESGTFYVWSATRPEISYEVKDQKPIVVAERRRLNPTEMEELQERLLKKEAKETKMLAAWELKVTVNETVVNEKADPPVQQHDLGPFTHTLPILVDGTVLENPPTLTGFVASDLEIGPGKSLGKIDLGIFAGSAGSFAKTVIWSKGDVQLEYARHEPSLLKVKLTKDDKESTPKRTKWLLEVRVPADRLYGPFPDKSAVYLASTRVGERAPPRLVRIPVLGTASGR